ncbi:hypothetical protein [Lederbergia lenta]|uniref:hypothetical protein n=1 Tax=Lederbergia lenta TaxID=1467 RepID=UPI002041E098|nr:hypothetical protein [Lederbergia lenta]MCM3109876.1 hypothetical protein [Lederbergia lenta]
MERTGWEHYELEKEISKSNTAQLLMIFKRESETYRNKCIEYVDFAGKLTEEGKKELEEECRFLNEGRRKIALTIAEILTDINRIQHQVDPRS